MRENPERIGGSYAVGGLRSDLPSHNIHQDISCESADRVDSGPQLRLAVWIGLLFGCVREGLHHILDDPSCRRPRSELPAGALSNRGNEVVLDLQIRGAGSLQGVDAGTHLHWIKADLVANVVKVGQDLPGVKAA